MKIVNTRVSPLSWGSLQTIITRLIGAGRATLFGVGLVVVLTLTAGGVTTALAAQPGDPFRLGEPNALDAATTILQGEQTNGAMLEIGNSSSDFDDPALILRVQAGRPPLEVSAGAGKAPNLDADKLDGKDSTEFASGTNGKANDADKLDGQDSSAFSLNKHTHDDRYYTKAQVDGAVNAAKEDAWAYVISNGALHATSGNLSVTHPATGQYCVVVSKRSSHKAAQATIADPGGFGRFITVGTGHGSACNPLSTPTQDAIPVYINDSSGTDVDSNFLIYVPAP